MRRLRTIPPLAAGGLLALALLLTGWVCARQDPGPVRWQSGSGQYHSERH